MAFFHGIKNFLRAPGRLYVFFGSFFIAAGWGWYHFNRHPKFVFLGKNLALLVAVTLVFHLFAICYRFLVRRSGRDIFWRETFLVYLAELYFFASLFFLVFFSTREWLSLAFFLVIFVLFFWRTQRVLGLHSNGKEWQAANRTIFLLSGYLFLVEAILQYAAYHYYILDSNIRFFDIVFFRSLAMVAFWMFGFAIASLGRSHLRGFWRQAPLIIWLTLFIFGLAVWVVNLGILYYSGLYFSPVAVEHASDAGAVIWNSVSYLLVSGALAILILLAYLLINTEKNKQKVRGSIVSYYNYVVVALALMIFFLLASFRNTPEFVITKSFINYYLGKDVTYALDPVLQKKLLKFGLAYEPDKFFVNSRSEIFTPTSTRYLPDRLLKSKPNILIIELESFSARLSDVYSSKYKNVTPNLLEFSKDPHSTVFKNYYNASTPSITGSLSQFCSFLPPIGHNEIAEERKMQNHHLLCLPEVLKKQAGYKYAAYVTAVNKEFAHKDGIFTSMGIDKIFGTEELKNYIDSEPLSWGYSDHQLFPTVLKFMKSAPQPFLMTLATIDTHPPFDLAKDAVNYGDGSRSILNMFHTTDDAFGKFWQEFKQTEFYKNTIVIAVADHAIFPGILTKELFPEDANSLTYYDQNFFVMYVPDSILPKEVDVYSSEIDITPTILQMLDINQPNSFEGHSIFDDRKNYPNLLGMHELGLYINQITDSGKRKVDYNIPTEIQCKTEPNLSNDLDLCEYLHFYEWKRQMLGEGRFWKH